MNAVTLNEAKEQLADLVIGAIQDVEPTVICGEGGEKAVLLSLDEFNSWKETLYLLSTPANAEHIQQSLEEARKGNVQEKKLMLLEPLF